jgi:hypothetical protein
MGKFDPFANSCKKDGVLADDVATPDGLNADFLGSPCSDHSMPLIDPNLLQISPQGSSHVLGKLYGCSTGGILFVMVVGLRDFHIKAVA